MKTLFRGGTIVTCDVRGTVRERSDLGQKRTIPFEETTVTRVLPVNRFENHLAFARTIEHDGGAGTMLGKGREDRASCFERQQAARQRAAVACLHDSAVVQNERQRFGQRFEDRPREFVAASGRERHLDARVDRTRHRVAIRLGDSAVTIEQRSIKVEG